MRHRSDRPPFVEEGRILLNGRRYHLSISGPATEVPILLFIHGGPGAPLGPYRSHFQKPLEARFLCVHWDQFASGKSYGLNPGWQTIAIEEAEADLAALIDWLGERFPGRPLVLLGFSWGSILGIRYAARHGERLAAYAGLAQSARPRAERHWRRDYWRCRLSRPAGWLSLWGEGASMLAGAALRTALFLRSPSYPLRSLAYLLAPARRHQRQLIRFMEEEYAWPEGRHRFACPLYFLTGAYDRITPAAVLRPLLEAIDAPIVRYQTIPRSGHNMLIDRPRMTAMCLLHWLSGVTAPRRYDDLVLDFDGTLADTLGIWKDLALDDLRARGLDGPADLDRHFKAMGLAEAAAYVQTHHAPLLTIEELLGGWQRLLAERYRQADLRPGAERFCRRAIQKGYRLHLLTLTPRHLVLPVLERTGLAPLFTTIMSGYDEGLGKDGTDLFDHLIAKAGLEASRSLVIEDSAFALAGARAAGLATCAIYADEHGPAHWLEARDAADLAVGDWQEALRLL